MAFDVKMDSVKLDVNQLLGQIGGIGREIRTILTGKEIEDPNKRIEAESKAREMENLLDQAQAKINEVQASHPSIFIAGPRPFVMWVCGFALGCYYVPQAVMATVLWAVACYHAGWTLQPFPVGLNSGELMQLLLALLGLGGLRTFEKYKGVEGNR